MDIKDEGICRFCMKTYAGRSIGRHLTACKVRKERQQQEAKGKHRAKIYHLKIQGYKPYWLHLEMRASAKLYKLDSFLRAIWLECCGHLSSFTIFGEEYSGGHPMMDGLDCWYESRSMDAALKKVLGVKDSFEYEYDFGSTTRLVGQVYAERDGYLAEPVRILARNNPPAYVCEQCDDAPADFVCSGCMEFVCQGCKEEHPCGEEYLLPVVNSPRMGVCGYTGNDGFDDFQPK